MGMYTNIIDLSKLKFLDENKLGEFIEVYQDIEECYVPFEWFTQEDLVETKFFGYWTNLTLKILHDLGKEKIIEGYFTCRYEEGDLLLCKINQEGFNYKIINEETINWDNYNWVI